MVIFTFLKQHISWTYILIMYCCHGNSTCSKKITLWVKEKNVQPLKPQLIGPFVVFLSSSTTVKVAVIAALIHHS
jgi:hypothetical protein